ncbi:MAG: transcriptional repressor [Actinobacteria bacterium]|nr:transcriptional repressor [Actinomycetota bacterium]MCB9388834.1 transcriptional repressor [Acidimicrobiia bacterium]
MELADALHPSGYRVTAARNAVWRVLQSHPEHLSAGDIADRVRQVDPGVNRSSVYRTLALFAELGLVRESLMEDGVHWEEAHADAVIHLVCTRCGKVLHHRTPTVAALERELHEADSFRPDAIDVRVSGACHSCQ